MLNLRACINVKVRDSGSIKVRNYKATMRKSERIKAHLLQVEVTTLE